MGRSAYRFFSALLLLVTAPPSCSSSDTQHTYTLAGVAQKGPFARGSQVLIAELDAQLVPTGRMFRADILNDSGAFALPDVSLTSNFVRLSADGFYFNEVTGQLADSRIVLDALADLSLGASVNVNVLTHLERPRLEVLLHAGMNFAAAKALAQHEVLAVFGFDLAEGTASERLDLAGATDDDAVLLAVSALTQGYRNSAELIELLSSISTDLAADGRLDDGQLGSALMNAGFLLDLPLVRANLEERYASLGVDLPIAAFEPHVQAFVASSRYEFTEHSTYPASGYSGPNLLDPTSTAFDGSFTATVPAGATLRVTMQRLAGDGIWYLGLPFQGVACWDATNFDWDTFHQEFTVERSVSKQTCEFIMYLEAGVSAFVSYYENGATEPILTKTVSRPIE